MRDPKGRKDLPAGRQVWPGASAPGGAAPRFGALKGRKAASQGDTSCRPFTYEEREVKAIFPQPSLFDFEGIHAGISRQDTCPGETSGSFFAPASGSDSTELQRSQAIPEGVMDPRWLVLKIANKNVSMHLSGASLSGAHEDPLEVAKPARLIQGSGVARRHPLKGTELRPDPVLQHTPCPLP